MEHTYPYHVRICPYYALTCIHALGTNSANAFIGRAVPFAHHQIWTQGNLMLLYDCGVTFLSFLRRPAGLQTGVLGKAFSSKRRGPPLPMMILLCDSDISNLLHNLSRAATCLLSYPPAAFRKLISTPPTRALSMPPLLLASLSPLEASYFGS